MVNTTGHDRRRFGVSYFQIGYALLGIWIRDLAVQLAGRNITHLATEENHTVN